MDLATKPSSWPTAHHRLPCLPLLQVWGAGPVTLLGDSAHLATPMLAQVSSIPTCMLVTRDSMQCCCCTWFLAPFVSLGSEPTNCCLTGRLCIVQGTNQAMEDAVELGRAVGE